MDESTVSGFGKQKCMNEYKINVLTLYVDFGKTHATLIAGG